VGIVEVPGEENTFNITGLVSDIEAPEEGTGFFVTLADLGVKTMAIDGMPFNVLDSEGKITIDKAAVTQAVAAGLRGDGTFALTFDVPYGDGSQMTSITYTFNLEA
jgi:hypothetical protein